MKYYLIAAGILSLLSTAHATHLEEFETAEATTYNASQSTLALNAYHFKSGKHSLAWNWNDKKSSLNLTDPSPNQNPSQKAGFALWTYQMHPLEKKMEFEALYQNRIVGRGWFWMDFTGWRILGANFAQIGVPKGQAVDTIRINAPTDSPHGCLFIDSFHIGFDYTAPTSLQTPWAANLDALNHSAMAIWNENDPSFNRPWLPQKTNPNDHQLADIETLQSLLLPHRNGPGKGLPEKKLAELREIFAIYQIHRHHDTISGRPIDAGTCLKPDGFIPFGDCLKHLEILKNAYYQSANPDETAEVKTMFCELTAHLLDQGWAMGSRLQGFENYPCGQLTCFYSMKPELAEAGLLPAVAKALFDGFCAQAPLKCFAEHPSSSMDGLGFWNRELYACALMFPSPKEQLQYLNIAKRFIDLAILEPTTIAPDGCTYHHGGFHYAYASYNLPRLLQVLEKIATTQFRIDAQAHERLRIFVRSLAFTSSAGEQSYNLGMRAGTPMKTSGVEAVARMLANIGTPDGKLSTDPEMAAISLRLLAESAPNGNHPNFAKNPWKSWLDSGIKPAMPPSGFLPLNGGTIAIHRRDGWIANIAGMTPHYRCLEIYGWTQSNNYARYARNGSLIITSQGSPPNLTASGWSYDGWNWSHFPGTTAVKVSRETDIFDGYAMYGNTKPNEGGTALGPNGVWCLDHEGTGVSFRKTYFCFDNRITSITSTIKSNKPTNSDSRITTLFQNSMNSNSSSIILDGDQLSNFPIDQSVTFEKNHWLIDSNQNGYLIPAGNDKLQLSDKEQTWRYMTQQYLVDKTNNPIVGDKGYQKIKSSVKDITQLEKYYQPSKGRFSMAWFDHGSQPDSASCVYTVVIKTTATQMRDFAQHSPIHIISQSDDLHILHDMSTDTFAYAIYRSGSAFPNTTPLLSCSQPCTIMLQRKSADKLIMSTAYTLDGNAINPEKNINIRIELQGTWHLINSHPLVETSTGHEQSTITIHPKNNLPITWELNQS